MSDRRAFQKLRLLVQIRTLWRRAARGLAEMLSYFDQSAMLRPRYAKQILPADRDSGPDSSRKAT